MKTNHAPSYNMTTPLTSETFKTVGDISLYYGAASGAIRQSEDGGRVAMLDDTAFRSKEKANEFGEYLVKAVNCHDELVAGLNSARESIEMLQRLHPMKETMETLVSVRAILAKATA